MRAVVQRVRSAEVRVAGEVVGRMGAGLLALVGAGQGDNEGAAEELVRKITNLRVFPDENGQMNLSLLERGGQLGIVSQFTLFGDTRKGRRPSYNGALAPERAAPLIDEVVRAARACGVEVMTGRFGALMEVELVGDGPVTLLVDTEKQF